jgi:hypothetical protein
MDNIYISSTALFTFFSWCVFTGGLSSMQYNCDNDGINVFYLNNLIPSDDITCKNVYRQSWFIMSYEIVILMMFALVSQKKMRMAFIGLFSVALMLYIDSSNQLLNAEFIEYYKYKSDSQLHRIRTMTAGSIMTATLNAFMIIVLGWKYEKTVTKPITTAANAV